LFLAKSCKNSHRLRTFSKEIVQATRIYKESAIGFKLLQNMTQHLRLYGTMESVLWKVFAHIVGKVLTEMLDAKNMQVTDLPHVEMFPQGRLGNRELLWLWICIHCKFCILRTFDCSVLRGQRIIKPISNKSVASSNCLFRKYGSGIWISFLTTKRTGSP